MKAPDIAWPLGWVTPLGAPQCVESVIPLSAAELEMVAAAGSKPGGDTGDPPEKPKPKPK